jgi:[CysO sulfur-carrier protein]-S-L-cysteine hydrolase
VVTHPGPATVALSAEIRAGIIEHARIDYPNEACGVIVGSAYAASGGTAVRFVPTRNAAASPSRYVIDSAEMFEVIRDSESRDEEIWGIVHSHTHSAAVPSPTDVAQAAWWPDALYLLISLRDDLADPATGEPGIRGWRIVDGEMFEVRLSR